MLQARTDLTSRIDTVDPEVAAAIRDEFERQQYTLELIPSENIASPAVLQALGSLLNNKYAEGSSVPRLCSAPSTPMSSRIAARPRTMPSTPPC
jgi:glycine/serine hydroxymethyltransferase